ncbi:MAG: site-2 protease family protein, partial [Deltaproteobacteria bacterium]|nr:site-2 protease family protein [Deltaproteobacteria bacterium]
VLRYSIGIGPAIVKYQPKGSDTIFQISALPLLAYVQIAGMNPAEQLDPNDTGSYATKKPWQRFLTVAAGPFANYLAAVIIIFAAGLLGWPTLSPELVIGQPIEGTPAAAAGLQRGDKIVRVEGRAVRTWDEVVAATSPRANKATRYTIRRRGRNVEYTITPRATDGRGRIGVGPYRDFVPLPVGRAAMQAVVMPIELTWEQLKGLGELVRQRSTENLMGPPGMVKELSKAASDSLLIFLPLMAVLSVSLGLINLLPFPALDGGRIVFIAYEMIIRRKVNERVEAAVHMVGIFVLLALILFLTVRDIRGS